MGKIYQDINISMVRLLLRSAYETLQSFMLTEAFKDLSEDNRRLINNTFDSLQNAHCSEWHINTF